MESLRLLQDQQSASFSSLSVAVNNMVSTVQHFIHSLGTEDPRKGNEMILATRMTPIATIPSTTSQEA